MSTLAYCILIALVSFKATAADIPWPMYQANAAHTGYVPVTLNPSAFAVRWVKTIDPGIALNPVAAANGEVFVSETGYYSSIQGLYALDPATGNILWSTNFGPVYPLDPPSYANGNVYIENGNGISGGNTALSAFQADTGTPVFSDPIPAQYELYLAPTLYNGNVYAGGGFLSGLYSFNGINGAQNWFGYVDQYYGWTPAVDANYCYVFTGSSLEPITGEFRIIDRFSGNTAYLVTDDGYQWDTYTMNNSVVLGTKHDAFAINEFGSIYPSSSSGRLLMFDLQAGGTNTPHIGWVLTDNFAGQPTLANGVLYANDGGNLVALDELTGSLLWSWTPPSGALTGNIIAANNLVLVGNVNSTYAIDLGSHQAVWSYPVGGSLSLGEGVLYIARYDGTLTGITAPSTNQPALLPPLCVPGGPYTAECNGATTIVQLDGSASSDPNGFPLTFSWSCDSPAATFNHPDSSTPTLTIDSTSAQSCTVTLVVSDGFLSATNQTSVTVVDTTPPSLSQLSATPSTLWPPNHKMIPVTVTATVTDSCDPAPVYRIASVTSSDPAFVQSDFEITGAHTVLLNAERSNAHSGRTYWLSVEAEDASGNIATNTTTVTVPGDQGN